MTLKYLGLLVGDGETKLLEPLSSKELATANVQTELDDDEDWENGYVFGLDLEEINRTEIDETEDEADDDDETE